MSKRDLKKYLDGLSKLQLEEQLLELYEKFNNVKTYYDFAFNPKEDQLVREAKFKISNEYFPIKGKKAKLRRSISQKIIKHFIVLGVDPFIIADIMLYNIEIAQAYTVNKTIKYESFFKSMLNSFEQAVHFMIEKGIMYNFVDRTVAIKDEAVKQNWVNKYEFKAIVERLEY